MGYTVAQDRSADPSGKPTGHLTKRVSGLMMPHELYLLPSPCFWDVFMAHLPSTLVYNIFSVLKRNPSAYDKSNSGHTEYKAFPASGLSLLISVTLPPSLPHSLYLCRL